MNLCVSSRELTTEVPCLLVACVTTTIALELDIVQQWMIVLISFAIQTTLFAADVSARAHMTQLLVKLADHARLSAFRRVPAISQVSR